MAIAVIRKIGRHKHKCVGCGRIWRHSDNRRNNEKAHTCRSCGTQNWYHYDPSETDDQRKLQELLISIGL